MSIHIHTYIYAFIYIYIPEYFELFIMNNWSYSIARAMSLIDARKGVTNTDKLLWQLLIYRRIQFMVILTKTDKLQPAELHESVRNIISFLQDISLQYGYAVWPYVHAVSALHNLGMEELRQSLSIIAHDADKKNTLRKWWKMFIKCTIVFVQ